MRGSRVSPFAATKIGSIFWGRVAALAVINGKWRDVSVDDGDLLGCCGDFEFSARGSVWVLEVAIRGCTDEISGLKRVLGIGRKWVAV